MQLLVASHPPTFLLPLFNFVHFFLFPHISFFYFNVKHAAKNGSPALDNESLIISLLFCFFHASPAVFLSSPSPALLCFFFFFHFSQAVIFNMSLRKQIGSLQQSVTEFLVV